MRREVEAEREQVELHAAMMVPYGHDRQGTARSA
jgi:hypothetical protein